MNSCFYNIPYPLIIHTFQNRLYGVTQLFLFLKMEANRGYIIQDQNLVEKYMEQTGRCSKTFTNNILKLIEMKWITVNSKKNELQVKGYSNLLNKIGYSQEHCTGITWENIYMTNFTAFVYAVIITKQAKSLKWRNKISESDKGGHSKRDFKPFLTLPHLYLAKSLNITKSKAQKMFRKAIKAGFILTERVFNKVPVNGAEANLLRKYAPDNTKSIRVFKNEVYIQKPNRIYSCIKLKGKRIKKKRIPYIRDIIKGR